MTLKSPAVPNRKFGDMFSLCYNSGARSRSAQRKTNIFHWFPSEQPGRGSRQTVTGNMFRPFLWRRGHFWKKKNTTPLFTARGIAIKFFLFSAGRRSGSGFVLRHDLFAALGREKKRRLRRGFASWSCCFNQSGLIAGFWRPGGACLCIYKDVLTWSSVLVLTLDCPPNSSQLLLPPARFALLLSVCYQPEKQKQKTKAEATKWRGQSVKRFARIGW